jgi:hypothetical protein
MPPLPQLKIWATTVVFAWNPSGVHWVAVRAAIDEGEKSITVYDSFRGTQGHPTTWRCAKLLPKFCALIGLNHPPFQGRWPDASLCYLPYQRRDDCGILITWACRLLLAGGVELPYVENGSQFANAMRPKLLGEIRAAINGDPLDTWDRLHQAKLDEIFRQEADDIKDCTKIN